MNKIWIVYNFKKNTLILDKHSFNISLNAYTARVVSASVIKIHKQRDKLTFRGVVLQWASLRVRTTVQWQALPSLGG